MTPRRAMPRRALRRRSGRLTHLGILLIHPAHILDASTTAPLIRPTIRPRRRHSEQLYARYAHDGAMNTRTNQGTNSVHESTRVSRASLDVSRACDKVRR